MSDQISYDVETVENAMRYLKKMQDLENIPNYGKLTHNPKTNKRYTIEEYKDRIDSTFYTDMATSTLAYTIYFLKNKLGAEFNVGIVDYCNLYATKGTHDLENNSEGEFAKFNGDESIFANLDGIVDIFQLYAYYNEFELLTGKEKKEYIDKNFARLNKYPKEYGIYSDFELIFKKKEKINGEEINFYYVSDEYFDMSEQMLLHDYNKKFLGDRFSGDLLDAIKSRSKTKGLDIVTFSENCFSNGTSDEPYKVSWAGLAYMDSGENIIVRSNYFSDVICHELGHLFDMVNTIDVGVGWLTTDYMAISIFGHTIDVGVWDKLADTYADDIAEIRMSAKIPAGYNAEQMKELHTEFYAEAFQLYFYSPETRAALPKKVRERIEKEINEYTN